jgi:hypothetical protein
MEFVQVMDVKEMSEIEIIDRRDSFNLPGQLEQLYLVG